MLNRHEREALDRHITGNWGEDSVGYPAEQEEQDREESRDKKRKAKREWYR